MGTIRAAMMTPSSVCVPPVSRTAKVTASAAIDEPSSEVASPAKKSRRSLYARAARRPRAHFPSDFRAMTVHLAVPRDGFQAGD
ncbi:hypothetical protein Ssi03_12190 [Sphaerisporangium siamense]|uniref:Uncharacterized protein n=1 Tax=Sphaerisporangium siamense TaxID=795645 RepID=A0A7W7DBL7_9ACTN|nr:hypothetical protein [Sphaerisporangium siamense]MBB4703010.1 hypothetical protein [Sphaerisporangium siamense]GII83229.1 hypothetical protein Ssi03_12190 [Sphaerisporangium siamense]